MTYNEKNRKLTSSTGYIKDIKEAIEFKLETRVQLVDKLKKKKQDNQ